VEKIAHLASRRKIEDLTIGPVLSWDNSRIKAHIDKILSIPGAVTKFGGKPLTNHQIPAHYGAY
jgi:1-pyrroline-5-carboxylate dehydrogenase